MTNASKSLEERLEDLGKSIASPPDSSEELLSLLDLADELLTRVEQSPSQSMLTGLKPLMSSLVAKELLRHSDTDVKAAVSSCISEITRITAPEAPYEDDIMKEIFQMIVGAFEGLQDTSSRSFAKRVSVLETVAKVRSCVVMLDLECDALILEMFRHFLNNIRLDHSENVYSAMETIMTLVIEESEEISSELLSCLLIVVKKDNKDVLPIARKLVEQVMDDCANKLKPYILEFVQSTGALLSDYSKVVASICQQSSEALENNETSTLGEIVVEDSKLSERTVSDEMLQVSVKQEQEVACPEKVVSSENSQKEASNNGTVQVGNSDAIAQPVSPKQKPERSRRNGPSADAVEANLADCSNSELVAVKPDGMLDLNAKNVKGRKSSSAQLTDTTDHSRMGSNKETPAVSSKRVSHSKEAEPSQVDDLSAKEEVSAGSLDPEKKNELQHHPVLENTSPDGASQKPSESLPEVTRSKRGRSSRRKTAKQNVSDAVAGKPASSCSQKDALGNCQSQNEVAPSKDDDKEHEHISRSEGKSERSSGKKLQLDVAAADDEEPATVTSDTEVKQQRQTGKPGLKRKLTERNISGKKHKSNIKQKGEVALEDDLPGEPSLKEVISSPGTPSKVSNIDQSHLDDSKKPTTSRKRSRGTENVQIPETSNHKEEPGANIVGQKIKVWWPDDKKFYHGVIEKFDRLTKKHTVVYTDGDIEILLLKKERWEFAGGNTKIDRGKQKDIQGTDTSQMTRTKASRGASKSPSKQPKTSSHSKSGNQSSDKSGMKPRGRSRGGVSNLEKYDDTPSISNNSKGKAKTPTSAAKLKTDPENEPVGATPSGKTPFINKDDTSKSSSKSKNALTRSGRTSKPLKSSSKLDEEAPKPSSKSGEATPKSGIQSEVDIVGDGNNTKKQGSMSKKSNRPDSLTPNGASSQEKAKVHENENTADTQDGTSTKRKKRRARK